MMAMMGRGPWRDDAGERPFGRGGGRRRRFDGGELRLILLKLIADQPRHGYDLIRAIEELSGGAYAPSPGVIYPTLTLLADMGLIEERPDGGARKLLAITDAGAAHLAEQREAVDAALARLAALAAQQEKIDAAPIRRAMHNLKAVLEHRLIQHGVDKNTLLAAAALIDEAAARIERL
jgi:DNA-binding PadR family transcriptional regulator